MKKGKQDDHRNVTFSHFPPPFSLEKQKVPIALCKKKFLHIRYRAGARSGAKFHRKEVSGMRHYELTFIVEPNKDEEGVTGVVERVT